MNIVSENMTPRANGRGVWRESNRTQRSLVDFFKSRGNFLSDISPTYFLFIYFWVVVLCSACIFSSVTVQNNILYKIIMNFVCKKIDFFPSPLFTIILSNNSNINGLWRSYKYFLFKQQERFAVLSGPRLLWEHLSIVLTPYWLLHNYYRTGVVVLFSIKFNREYVVPLRID